MSPYRSISVLGWLALLVILYVLLINASCRGCGYAGYGGYHRPASFWYWGGVSTYHSPSVRTGSAGGPGVRGGGIHGGK